MKKWRILLVIAFLAMIGQTHPVGAEPLRAGPVTTGEALNVASNWVRLVLHQQGTWGGSPNAEVEGVQELRRGERLVGYVCRVNPQGFVVVSLYRGLAPVKAYSEISGLDPESEEGLADVIKGGMERVLIAAERLSGPLDALQAEEWEDTLEINYRQVWETLQVDAPTFQQRLGTNAVLSNYGGGDPPLLTTHWEQGDPYNQDCPAPPPGDDCTAAHCDVGCVATAGAQVMRHWAWPPSGIGSPYNDSYDWPNMPDTVTAVSPTAQINAIAELSHEVGVAAGMDYCGHPSGPCASGAYMVAWWTTDLMDALVNQFRYSSNVNYINRGDYGSAVDWFNEIKAQLNLNRPLPYRVEGHAIVADGWRERIVASSLVREYHMNYGWGDTGTCQDGCDTWYVLDGLHLGDAGTELVFINLYPAPSLGPVVAGPYIAPSFPYRYFDQDATGVLADFFAGQYLQSLPGVTVKCTGPVGGRITFHGSSGANTVLFTDGDTSRGIRIRSGQIRLLPNGGIKLYE
jgi:hypothetical protein